jgi:hypothetical protein
MRHSRISFLGGRVRFIAENFEHSHKFHRQQRVQYINNLYTHTIAACLHYFTEGVSRLCHGLSALFYCGCFQILSRCVCIILLRVFPDFVTVSALLYWGCFQILSRYLHYFTVGVSRFCHGICIILLRVFPDLILSRCVGIILLKVCHFFKTYSYLLVVN